VLKFVKKITNLIVETPCRASLINHSLIRKSIMKKTKLTQRKSVKLYRGIYTFVMLSSIALFPAFVKADDVSPKPNFVIIIGDDSTYHDYGFEGSPNVKTPNLDRLADEGVRLTRFYSPASVCSPLRQTLLTGMYSVRNGAYPNHSKVYPEVKSLPVYLKPLGYRSACVGKTHFNPRENYPFDLFVENIEQDENKTTVLSKLESFIKQSSTEPFVLYVASNEPHEPHNKGDDSVYDESKIVLPPYLADTPETRQELKKYYAEITYLDWQAGQVLELLKKTGHDDDTLVFFFSEQGNSLPHGKWTLYDAGIRVAAIARVGMVKFNRKLKTPQ